MNEDTAPDVVEVPLPEAEVTPVKVTLAELAAVNNVPSLAARHAARVAALRKPLHRTPAGLPKGRQWLPHDTGQLGYAAARRRAQMEKLAARRAKVLDVDGEVRRETE